MTARKPLTPADLPLELPEPCPVCGARLALSGFIPPGFGYVGLDYGCDPKYREGDDARKAWAAVHFSREMQPTWEAYRKRAAEYLESAYRWAGD